MKDKQRKTLILLIVCTLSCSVSLAQNQRSASYEKRGIKAKGIYGADYLSLGIEDRHCTETRVRSYFNEFASQLKPSVITRARQNARSTLTRSLARPSTSASAWLSQLRRDVKAAVQNMKVDFSQMAVEDAIMLMFMLISENAEKDLKEMLKEMKDKNKKREALRENTAKLKEEICHLMDQMEKPNNRRRRP